MTNSGHNSAFVLVLVLIVLAAVGTFMATAARRSGDAALRAAGAQEQLQLKWGTISCQNVFLPHAPRILQQSGNEPALASASAGRRSVTLGGIRFDVTVYDEQAKANVNMLAGRQDKSLESDLAELQLGVARAAKVRLRPHLIASGAISRWPLAYLSLDQVFEYRHPSELLAPDGQPGPIDRITCWGSGKVNVRRASADVIRLAVRGILTEIDIAKMERLLTEDPGATLKQVSEALELKPDKVKLLEDVLTERSDCHSLWVVATGKTRNWRRLYVQSAGDERSDSQRWVFQW